jgi:hypothetical protein
VRASFSSCFLFQNSAYVLSICLRSSFPMPTLCVLLHDAWRCLCLPAFVLLVLRLIGEDTSQGTGGMGQMGQGANMRPTKDITPTSN